MTSPVTPLPHPDADLPVRPQSRGFPVAAPQLAECLTRRSRLAVMPLILLSAAILVQGCARPYGTVVRQFRDAPVCCASLAEIPVEPLQIGDTKSFSLGEGTPAYRFDTGKSYFRAFALPHDSYPYRVTVRSFLVGDSLKVAYLFSPQLMTLDADRRVVRTTGLGTFSLERTGFLETMRETGGLRHKLEGGLTFTGENGNERYLVVLTTDELLGGKTPVSTVGDVPMFVPGYAGTPPAQGEVQVPHGPAGRLSVTLAPLNVEKVSPAVAASRPRGGGEDSRPAPRPGVVTVRLPNGAAMGEIEPGRTTLAEARHLYENGGAGLGEEHASAAVFTIGTATLAPKRLFTPPGTRHQLYFDDSGILVLFVDGAPATLPRTGREFRQRFPAAREGGRTLASYELRTPLTPCISLIAVFRAADDTLDTAAYGCGCPEQ